MKNLFKICALAVSVITFQGVFATQVHSNFRHHAAVMQHLICAHNCCNITPLTLVGVQMSAAKHSFMKARSYIARMFIR